MEILACEHNPILEKFFEAPEDEPEPKKTTIDTEEGEPETPHFDEPEIADVPTIEEAEVATDVDPET